ncbi:MAG: hypothetical protein Q8916_13715 [Bacteroidota bacterium]|nr:hypothetical protein [Bacteroidota bacterium]MDP4231451.1 hypothetical protein [Bacteroidota bacterium]MDP4234999.1 hypothetical protein [Bacteroidota bacterium]
MENRWIGRKQRQVRVGLYVPFFAVLVIGFSSCDLFSTRAPASPDFGSTFIWTPAELPSTLMSNFKGTIEVLDATNYTKCFIGAKDSAVTGEKFTYTFTPRSGLDAVSRSLFDLWNIQSEQNFMTKLKSALVSNPKLNVTFSNTNYEQLNSNSARITSDYLILLPVQTNSTIPSSISGSMILQLALVTTEQGTKEWRIVNWSDFPLTSGNSSTFTDLKLQLSS